MCNIFTRDDFFSLSLVFKENEEVISRDRKKKVKMRDSLLNVIVNKCNDKS